MPKKKNPILWTRKLYKNLCKMYSADIVIVRLFFCLKYEDLCYDCIQYNSKQNISLNSNFHSRDHFH